LSSSSTRDKGLVSVMNTANRVIRRYTTMQELIDEFPSYAVEQWMTFGPRPWKYLVVDFFRSMSGRQYYIVNKIRIECHKHIGTLVPLEPIAYTIEDISIDLDKGVFLGEFKEVALASIGNRQMKEVMYLYFWGGMSMRQIGEAKNLSEGRVSQLLKKTIKKLKENKSLTKFNS